MSCGRLSENLTDRPTCLPVLSCPVPSSPVRSGPRECVPYSIWRALLRERAGAIARETGTPRGATAKLQRWQCSRCRQMQHLKARRKGDGLFGFDEKRVERETQWACRD